MSSTSNNGLIISLFFSAILLILTNCSDNSGSVSITIISANEQTGTAGQEPANPIIIHVIDIDDNPIENLNIRFKPLRSMPSVNSDLKLNNKTNLIVTQLINYFVY